MFLVVGNGMVAWQSCQATPKAVIEFECDVGSAFLCGKPRAAHVLCDQVKPALRMLNGPGGRGCWNARINHARNDAGDFIGGKVLIVVAEGGIEPPTQGFSVLCSTN